MKRLLIIILISLSTLSLRAQMPDTTGIYGERKDSLGAAVASASAGSNRILKTKENRVEMITASGLCTMACCNLAESFENSASVTVGYSDAVTGARQIRLLGQSGIYTQMLDENRPTMRGLAAPWGLTFVPSQWLQSIQIAKGVTSVINGVESMTGQINLEHRKPTDERPLFLQASINSETKGEINIASAFNLNEEETWSTVILGHVCGNIKALDLNGDGFMDDPKQLDISLGNRWLYYGKDGVQVRFGINALQDNRTGGQMDEYGWRSDILNRQVGGYAKIGVPLNVENTRNIAAIANYDFHMLDSKFWTHGYNGGQHSGFANILFQDHSFDQHHYTVGISEMLDIYNETFWGLQNAPAAGNPTTLSDLGIYGEYTFHSKDEEKFSAIVGLRADWYNLAGIKASPRLTLKYAPVEQLVLRANGGRGLRYSTPLIDNIGVMSTNKILSGNYWEHPLEDSWTVGGNVTWYLPFDKKGKSYLSFDYFHTGFTEQMIADYTDDTHIVFHTLSNTVAGFSYTDNFQFDFFVEPVAGFTINLTARYTDARQSLYGCKSFEKPLTSRFKGVLTLQYATPRSGWIFDFTTSVNGPCRVWDFMMKDPQYSSGYTKTYPLLFAQVTKKFKRFDIYLGGENLTNFRQENPIISANNPYVNEFDASCIWGPLTGIKAYLGFRLNIESKHHCH